MKWSNKHLRSNLPILIIFIFLILLLVSSLLKLKDSFSLSPAEQKVSIWNDGTDAFYQQVIKSSGEWVENAGNASFDNQPVQSISKTETENILAKARESQVLGLHTGVDGTEKWIEIDLSDLRLYAWEGNRKVFEFLISTGRPGYNTPTGEFKVWRKVRSQAYRGGSQAIGDYYYLPNVPFSLFFGGGNIPDWRGYAIHGAYWHNDFGIKNRSSGCVNVKPEEAGLLYSWAGPAMSGDVGALNASSENPGVRIVIHD